MRFFKDDSDEIVTGQHQTAVALPLPQSLIIRKARYAKT